MPELPEVETTRKGIEPHIKGAHIQGVLVREPRLRWPVPDYLGQYITGQKLLSIARRGKYLLLHFETGTLIIHLGMSGNLRIIPQLQSPAGAHDHVDLVFTTGMTLRYSDPRRFGSIHWTERWQNHWLLESLGPEPFDEAFNADYLRRLASRRKAPVKHFVMDSKVVVGVGNIYASEALFTAGIRPMRAAGQISRNRYQALVEAVRHILGQAIQAGGTTLKDFVGNDGKPGYFANALQVYGRGGLPCLACTRTLKEVRLGNRSTVYCSFCQT